MSRPATLLRAAVGVAATRLGRPPAGALVLAWHDIVEDAASRPMYVVGLDRFRAQLDLLERLSLRVVRLADLADDLRLGRDVTGQVALVFDDALVGVHHLALPELAARALPFTLHVVADALGAQPPWWPSSRRTMTAAELCEAVAGGANLAAHGLSHACLPCQPDAALREELQVPRGRLQDLVAQPLDDLAYPFGHVDERVREATLEAGYRTGWTFLNGRARGIDDPWMLHRLAMHHDLTPARLALQLGRPAGSWPRPEPALLHPRPCTSYPGRLR